VNNNDNKNIGLNDGLDSVPHAFAVNQLQSMPLAVGRLKNNLPTSCGWDTHC